MRWARRRTVTVQAAPNQTTTYPDLKNAVYDKIAGIDLPPGYAIFYQPCELLTHPGCKILWL